MKIPLDDFRSSTSSFRKNEETAINVKIKTTTNINDIFEQKHISDINNNLIPLLLPEYNEAMIKAYIPSKDDNLSTHQRKFLVKLRQVLINNDPDSEAPQCEKFVDDLLSFICDLAELDDGLELTLRPCNLKLQIDTEIFAAIADREGRRGQELAWIIQEDKHRKSSTYKHGDLQLACAMIAANQQNYNLLGEVYPVQIIGLKAVASNIYFCSMKISETYLEELIVGLPSSSVTMHKYPPDGLSLSNPSQREQILKHLTTIRNTALSIDIR
jgi:hypothetical protein